MGHELAIIDVNESKTAPLTNSAIISAALNEWGDTKTNRYASANVGDIVRTKPMTPAQANNFFGHNDVNSSVSYVIPVVSHEDSKTSTKKVKITVGSDVLKNLSGNSWQSRDAVSRVLAAEYGDKLVSVEILNAPKPRKAVAVTTEGKASTKYFVVGRGGTHPTHSTILSSLFDSQAEARAAALALFNEGRVASYIDTLEVQAKVVREDGNAALVSITRPTAESGTVEVQITLSEPKAGAKIDFYRMGFDYHV